LQFVIDPASCVLQLSLVVASVSPLLETVPAFVAQSIFWAAVLLCVAAHIAIVRSLLRASSRRPSELAWAVLPAVVLAAVLVVTWHSMHIGK
jgi:quinol-cytochrome oxidoreductase complex cytochrome b subunit